MLDPIIPTSHCTKDSFTSCEEIKKASATNRFLISYDVCSLFTSIPLNETTETAVNLLFDHNPGLNITKTELKKRFEFAASGTYFLFQGTFYDQIEGVAMCSPLGPILANLFMGYYETLWLNAFRECEIILYRRYDDDIICLFNCESDADKFFEFLNTQHLNIKFTFEKQVIKQFSFLDVLITNDGDQFYTSVFRKETAIDLFTNYLGFTPFSYKVGLVRTLLHCAFMISSSWFLFHEEVVKIKHYLEKYSYPLSFADKQVNFFLENKINEKSDTVNATNNVVKFYKLPYIGHISIDVKRKINRFCKFYCKSLSIKIILTTFKVADMFNVKDPTPKSLKSFVVYKFVCPGCNACYIGETTRHLSTRIKEHLETDKKSHIFAHLVNNETCKTLSTGKCFEIIDSAATPFRLKLKEAMHIIWKKPALNKQQNHVSISLTV